MKRGFYILAITVGLWSCGGGGGGDTPEPPAPTPNTAPSVPTLVAPSNNLLCIDNVLNFQWNASTDAEGNSITYQLQVATDTGFTQVQHSQNTSSTSVTISLDKGVFYYWRVRATDSKNASSDYSTTNQFYTEAEAEVNHAPFPPTLVSPALGSTQSGTVTLEWTSTDVDTGDTLSYDVYVSDSETFSATPTYANVSTTTQTHETVASTTYYWKVVAKDTNGAQTHGQTWLFNVD